MNCMLGGGNRHTKACKPIFTIVMSFLAFIVTICLYLTRLEDHTRADIFLPTNYHSTLDPASIDDLESYYHQYTSQEGRPYTIRQDLLLSRLAYIHAPQGFHGETTGVTVRDLCVEIERTLHDTTLDAASKFGRNRQELLGLISSIAEFSVLCDLQIREYITDASGLAGYVFEDNDGDITISLRGTDDPIDMLDNIFLLPFNISVQYPAVRALLLEYADAPRIWLTGHSKGGHNAIYAASIDPRCRATGFNAPGFGVFLTDAQHDGLDNGVNYVINGDITGFLLFHMERRVVLESLNSAVSEGLPTNNKHRLDNFFAVDDLTVAKRILPLGIASEWVTQIVWLALIFLAGYGMIRVSRLIIIRVIRIVWINRRGG
ncbi:hypothetical protein FACS1894184_18970 [Clostridia bacterium]|nr:hypothetical protein FACS1894184_18970 [Clostridia bacterium]